MPDTSSLLEGAASSSKAGSRIKLIGGGLLIVALMTYLIISSISVAGAYYREVDEVLAQRQELTGKNLRVSGDVVAGSIRYDAAGLDLSFAIADPRDATRRLDVHFRGVRPAQIGRGGSSAIVEGLLRPDGVVEASNLLLKCPSRYDEKIEVEAAR